MGMDVGGRKRGPRSEINVTPFVDVVLVLLIIFMVLTPLLLREIGVTIPRKADEEVTADLAAQQLVLAVSRDGRLELAGSPVSLEALASRTRALFAARKEKLLFVRIDDEASYGLAVDVMDRVKGAGVQTIGMTTKGGGGSEGKPSP
jgi:biopolymer transport protein ExbD